MTLAHTLKGRIYMQIHRKLRHEPNQSGEIGDMDRRCDTLQPTATPLTCKVVADHMWTLSALTAAPGPDGNERERMGQRAVCLEDVRSSTCSVASPPPSVFAFLEGPTGPTYCRCRPCERMALHRTE